MALTGLLLFVILLTFWILSPLQDARMNARTFVKCAAVWFAICLAFRPARARVVKTQPLDMVELSQAGAVPLCVVQGAA